MNKTEKAEIISEIKQNMSESTAVFLVDYHGISVEEVNGLRKDFRKEGLKYKVYKNTLFKKALEEVEGYSEFKDILEGMIGTVFAGEDNFVAPAKLIKKFNDDKKKFNFKGCYIESEFYGSDKLETLASMPTRDEVMASIVGSVAAPMQGIVGAINAVMRDITILVDEISKKKAA